ncbi:RHS repeat-associated core domain-containing protein [Opitutus sp. ER46]|uniref:RHS repeat-associated core domain-containing protein n=1 Tax=Opitutus sp. ER46 TaxID=2161864 RepID=UPI000D318824|nr:RHS repeat-associated core domain-containing protein [Opitutus sp. ER46]PTY01378.1 hypothetical protein DB354_00020 [Opitutus sp. ER46]
MTTGPSPSGAMKTYSYDARNRLTSFDGSGYTYNPDGLRTAVTGTGAASFLVDPNAALSRVLRRTKGGVTTYYVYGHGLLYQESGGVTRTYHGNQVGSTLVLTDDSQNVTDRIGYAPYGTITERTGSTDTPFLFNGEYGVMTDTNGLICMRARYYNPRLMRFLNADPIGFGGGLNWYASFDNNPVSKTDPLGLWGSDYHLDRTKELSSHAGFSDQDAARIARADNNVDSVWLGKSWMPVVGNQGYHFNTNDTKPGAVDSRIAYSQIHLDKAISYQAKADNLASGGFFSRLLSGIFHSLAMSNLGKALHPAQDVSAHTASVTQKAAGVYYHAQDGTVDNMPDRPDAVKAADEATNAILNKYQEGVSAGGCRK